MKIEMLDKTDEKIRFTVDDINPPLANAMRRTMRGEVPTMAVKSVDFLTNSSALYNEVLAHRLALVPLEFDAEAMNVPDECVCEGDGCVQCEAVLVLKKEGPAVVYTSDINSNNDDVNPVYDNMPIVKLLEGQKLEFEAVATLGRGKEHAKWQASISSYRYYPKITVEDISSDEAEEIADKCPNAFKRVGRGVKVNEDNLHNITDACIEALPEGVKLDYDDTRFVFEVETVSGLTPKEVVMNALEVLRQKADEFESEIAEYK